MLQLVKQRVVSRLQATYGEMYNDDNVCLSGTHSHSTPAGFLEYVLFQITALGFVNESAQAYEDGIYESFVKCVVHLCSNQYVSIVSIATPHACKPPLAYQWVYVYSCIYDAISHVRLCALCLCVRVFVRACCVRACCVRANVQCAMLCSAV